MYLDLRFGLRMLLKHKGFTIVAGLTLALGIGANTAMFSVLNTYLFRNLPYPSSERLIRVFRTSIHSTRWPHSAANFLAHRDKNPVQEGLGSISLLGSLLAAFALLGLLLARIGIIYGVTSYTVVQRTGEFGIRMALGAQRRDVLWLVVSRGGGLILTGAVIGFGGAYGVARLLASAIPTLPSRDPFAMVALAGTLLAVGLVACYLPARQATKVDPLTALRHE